jgi:acetylglutamate kinase
MNSIQSLNNLKLVVKLGGSILSNEKLWSLLAKDIAQLSYAGVKIAVVHGGGPFINKALEDAGIKTATVNGLRVTDGATMNIVKAILNNINISLVASLINNGVYAVSFGSECAALYGAQKKQLPGVDLGYVGDITHVATKPLLSAMASGKVPVVAPIGFNEEGVAFNLNADEAALHLATALHADKLINLTDVPGVLSEPSNPQSVLHSIAIADFESLVQKGIVKGGMLVKLSSCISGLTSGIGSIHIASGQGEHALLNTLFHPEDFGTVIHR